MCNGDGMVIQEGTRAGVISVTVWLLVNGEPYGLKFTWRLIFLHINEPGMIEPLILLNL